ncbi:MAG: ferritin-like domain-containing protein [Gammaproteobacteria bacterium]|nr:ferritin-like domain-containing protein [Gammaproteobacteria bacterium]
MRIDQRTLGWLSRALTHEMRAVQQYLAQSVLARGWGDEALAEKLRSEAVEELGHAERLMERLIAFGISPSAGNLPPSRLGRSVDDLLAADRELEIAAVRLYQEAVTHTQRMRDSASTSLLEDILAEEMAHVQEIDSLRNNNHG